MITFTIGPTITFSKVWYRDERTTVRVHTRLLRIRITTGSWIPHAASIEKETDCAQLTTVVESKTLKHLNLNYNNLASVPPGLMSEVVEKLESLEMRDANLAEEHALWIFR